MIVYTNIPEVKKYCHIRLITTDELLSEVIASLGIDPLNYVCIMKDGLLMDIKNEWRDLI